MIVQGNVGIGTIGTGAKLDVSYGGGGGPVISGTVQSNGIIRARGGNGVIDMGVLGNGKGWLQGTDATNLSVTYGLLLQPNGGNVGVGSLTPGQTLDVNGTVRATGFTMSGSSPSSGLVLTATDSQGDATWSSAGTVSGWTSSGANVYETSAGNVGIGTTTPQGSLVVTNGNVGIGTWAPGGSLVVQTGNVGIGSASPGTALDVSSGDLRIGSNHLDLGTDNNTYIYPTGATGNGMAFVTNGTERMRIQSGGNIGIGTTSPQNAALVVTDGNVGVGTWAPGALLQVNGSSNTPFTVSSSGNVGVGTIANQVGLSVMNANVGIGTWTAAGGNLIVNGGGNVGIGSAWPGSVLDVEGTVRATAFTGIGVPVYAQVASGNTTTTSTTLTNITGLSIALLGGDTYEFETQISANSSTGTNGLEFGVNYSGTSASVEAGAFGSYTTNATSAYRISATNTATSAFLTSSAQSGSISIKGIMVTTGAGNITIQYLKVTSGTATVYANSYLKVTRIS